MSLEDMPTRSKAHAPPRAIAYQPGQNGHTHPIRLLMSAGPKAQAEAVRRVRAMLVAAKGNQADAAAALGCSWTSLHRWLKELGLASFAAQLRQKHGVVGGMRLGDDGLPLAPPPRVRVRVRHRK